MNAPTVEHAYQAFKCVRLEDALRILSCATPGETKRLSRQLAMRPDWDEIKLQVMAHLLALKFDSGSHLASLLLATDDAELIEGNTWGDDYWGVCRGRGKNHLGKLLMKHRELLRTL